MCFVADPSSGDPLVTYDAQSHGPVTALSVIHGGHGRGIFFVVGHGDGYVSILQVTNDQFALLAELAPGKLGGAVLRAASVHGGSLAVVRGTHSHGLGSQGSTTVALYAGVETGRPSLASQWAHSGSAMSTAWRFADLSCHSTPLGTTLVVSHNNKQTNESDVRTFSVTKEPALVGEVAQQLPSAVLATHLAVVGARLSRFTLHADSLRTDPVKAVSHQPSQAVNVQAMFVRLRELYTRADFVHATEDRRRARGGRLFVDLLFDRIPFEGLQRPSYPPDHPEDIFAQAPDTLQRTLLLYYMLCDLEKYDEVQNSLDSLRLHDGLSVPTGHARLIDAYWALDNGADAQAAVSALVHPQAVPFQAALLSGMASPQDALNTLVLAGTTAPWMEDADEGVVIGELAGLVRRLMANKLYHAALAVQRKHDDEAGQLLSVILQAVAEGGTSPAGE